MNVENLRKTYPVFLKYLEDNRYSKWRVGRYATEIRNVLRDGSKESITSYEQLAKDWIGRYSATTLYGKIGMLWSIRDFDLYGVNPKIRSFVPLNKRVFSSSNNSYWVIVEDFRKHAMLNGVRDSSICAMEKHAISFFEFLIKRGCMNLHSVKESDVLAFFNDGETMIRGHQYMYHIKYVLRENGNEEYKEECVRIISYLPKIKVRERVYPYLTDEEIQCVKKVIEDKTNLLSYRDRAIVTIALYTGIRGCDIAGLRLDDIDFLTERISICQQKTSESQSIPLRPVVGNAIVEYVRLERPTTSYRNLFITQDTRKEPLSTAEIRSVITGVFLMAGVRVEAGLKGSHLFRHHVAMSLLGADIPNPTISSVLGHKSLNSIEPYLESDIDAKRKCAISVEEFPMREEVLCL